MFESLEIPYIKTASSLASPEADIRRWSSGLRRLGGAGSEGPTDQASERLPLLPHELYVSTRLIGHDISIRDLYEFPHGPFRGMDAELRK